MTSRIFRHAALPALMACTITAACSGTPPAPAAFVNASVGSGNNGNACPFGSTASFATIGTPTGPKPLTQSDGSTQAGQAVHVTCTVSASGGGFNVLAAATVDGPGGGTLAISGHVDSSGQGLTGGFTGQMGQSYDQSNGCAITYTMNGQAVPTTSPIAGGRIWGHIDCPKAQKNGTYQGTMLATCDAQADFLFENCSGG